MGGYVERTERPPIVCSPLSGVASGSGKSQLKTCKPIFIETEVQI